MQNTEYLIGYYLKNSPTLQIYAKQSLDALLDGSTAVEILPQDLSLLQAEIQQNKTFERLFVIENNHFSMQRYYAYEKQITDFIKQKIQDSNTKLAVRKQQLIDNKLLITSLFADFSPDPELSSKENIDWQKIALIISFLTDFAVITGGPGTGKTSTVSKLLALLFSINPKLKVALTAQTGKASARLKESLDASKSKLKVNEQILSCFDAIEPKTIHRLLGFRPNLVELKYHSANKLPYDLIIVDEASMVDLPMMSKLFAAIDTHTKVILLGDQHQLPSVEMGTVLKDLCHSLGGETNCFSSDTLAFLEQLCSDSLQQFESKSTHFLLDSCVQLQRSYRFSSILPLGNFAKKILENEAIHVSSHDFLPKKQGVLAFENMESKWLDIAFEKYGAYLLESDPLKSIKLFNDFRVLCATREGSMGVQTLNVKIEQWLSDHKGLNCREKFYVNRPIMITKNDYNLGLYNGDIGLIKPDEQGECKVFFEDGNGGVKSFEPAFLSNFQTVFAMTIHKSQGSEFKNLLLVLPATAANETLNRQLLYTAITRAKEYVFLMGSQQVFDAAQSKLSSRKSNLSYLLDA